MGLFGNYYSGIQIHINKKQEEILNYLQYFNGKSRTLNDICFLSPEQKFSDFNEACFSKTSPSILIWGDSHAQAFSYALRNNYNHNVMQLTASSCKPITEYNPADRPNCKEINDYVFSKIEQIKPAVIILHANWISSQNEIENGLDETISNTILTVKQASPHSSIFILGGVPQWLPSLPELLVKLKILLEDKAFVRSARYNEVSNIDAILSDIADKNTVHFISILDLFCHNEKCLSSVKRQNKNSYEPFAWDYGHLTETASVAVLRKIVQGIEDNKKLKTDKILPAHLDNK